MHTDIEIELDLPGLMERGPDLSRLREAAAEFELRQIIQRLEDEWEGVLAAVGAAEIRIGGRCPGVRRPPAIPTAAYATSRRCR